VLDDSRPLALAVFAGIWTTWHGKRGTKSNPIEGEHQLFGFLSTDANAEVAPSSEGHARDPDHGIRDRAVECLRLLKKL